MKTAQSVSSTHTRPLLWAALLLLAILGWSSVAAAQSDCPLGKSTSADTGGHCCWPGQAWADNTCVGRPTRCPDGFAYTEGGQACQLKACGEGQLRTADGIHCCWPGQGWSSGRGQCVGQPQCPAKYVVKDNGCEPGPQLTDQDADRIADADDECPRDPEDFDGFKDRDGCPDQDNDGDGIADPDDNCPLEAEDRDGHLDKDGCPDRDNDGDTIPDAEDRCPNRPEDVDGNEDADGCPDDDDGDGVPDADDQCNGRKEDHDGFEDGDGCPEPDNDQDGYADVDDQCDNRPEDFDLYEDGDGCPDNDNDADGGADLRDVCPTSKEDGRGEHPDNGCKLPLHERWALRFLPARDAPTSVGLATFVQGRGLRHRIGLSPRFQFHWGNIEALVGLLGISFYDRMPHIPKTSVGRFHAGDLAVGVPLLEWPRHPIMNFSLVNLSAGAHVRFTFPYATDEYQTSGGLYIRQAFEFARLGIGIEYRNAGLFRSVHRAPGPNWTFVIYRRTNVR